MKSVYSVVLYGAPVITAIKETAAEHEEDVVKLLNIILPSLQTGWTIIKLYVDLIVKV